MLNCLDYSTFIRLSRVVPKSKGIEKKPFFVIFLYCCYKNADKHKKSILQNFHPSLTSPGTLSILITMLRHNMAAISEIGVFRTRSALFVICSVILALTTHSSIRENQGRNELHVCQRWLMKAKNEGANFTPKKKEHNKFCVQIRYVFPLCR